MAHKIITIDDKSYEFDTELSDETLDLIQQNKWQEAMNSTLKRDEVVQVFLQILKDNQWKKFADKLTNSEKVIAKWIDELGFRDATNPYLKFIPIYFSDNNAKLSENNAVALNNLYAKDVIDFADISGTGQNRDEHIIFNPNLYNLNMSDLEFIVKAYESLSNKNFIDRLNVDAIASESGEEFANYLSQYKQKLDSGDSEALRMFRNAIIFKDAQNPKNSEINSRYNIEKLLSAGENTAGSKSSQINKLANQYKNEFSKYTEKEDRVAFVDALVPNAPDSFKNELIQQLTAQA